MGKHGLSLLTLILFLTGLGIAQQPAPVDPVAFFDEHKRWCVGNTEPWFQFFDIPEAEIRKSIVLWEEIGKGLRDIDDSLNKGRFGSGGSTHGSYLRWTRENGFIWIDVDYCQGGPTRILHGRVELIPEGVALVPEKTLGRTGGHGGHGQHSGHQKRIPLVAIKWMHAIYLVPKESVVDFADYSAGLGDYNTSHPFMSDHPFFVMGTGDASSNPAPYSPPVYPRGYDKFDKRPVRGSIISIGKGRRQVDPDSDTYDRLVTPFRIKLENTSNLKASLKLHPVGEENGYLEEFELKSFKGNVAVVESIRLIPKKTCVVSEAEDCRPPEHLKLCLGLILSSNNL